MALIRWNPEQTFFPSLRGWLTDFFDDDSPMSFPVVGISMPAVNVSENDEAYTVEVAAPGFSKDHFRVEVQNGCLTISAEVKEEKKEEKEGKYTRREFRYGTFSRSFTLPENVDESRIAAKYTDGILRIQLPKKHVDTSKSTKSIAIE
ncbi:MAG: Hsp20/alpha crystallin family protein [Saprospiraceae bacterium]|nr:Hsp20/alpha crystallin family protein [Saprospiraceae bacterium]MDW8483004.1 Hsp20/alpha crystallin family protein [Saprospiraceae bacterium]